MHLSSTLLDKIAANNEIIGVIGLDNMGLSLAVAFAQSGTLVIGFDKSQDKVDHINRGKHYIKDLCDAVLSEVVENFALTATTDFSGIRECDVLLICVPTPPDKFCKPNMLYIESLCIAIGKNMKPGTFISLESTIYPPSTKDFMMTIIEDNLKSNPLFKDLNDDLNKNLNNEQSTSSFPPSGRLRGASSFWLIDSCTPAVLDAMTKEGLGIREKVYSKAIEHLQLV